MEYREGRTVSPQPMLELSPAGSGLSPQLLSLPGGFLWWYLDLVDGQGNGLVVIWSFGLPFIPGYAQAARRGTPQEPQQRPSLNVCVYDQGELDFYLLQEYEPQDVEWEQLDHGDRWQFGDSHLESLVDDQCGRRVKLELRLDVPATEDTALIGVEAEGPGCHRQEQTHDPSHRQCQPLPEHDWVPLLCACQGRAVIETSDGRSELVGRAYHDRNGGSLPLHDIGIDSWIWGRVAMKDSEFIYYVLDGMDSETEAHFFEIDPGGRIQECKNAEMKRPKAKTNLGGLKWWPSMTIERGGEEWLHIAHRNVVDSGPFYLRSVLEAHDDKRSYRGIAEVCDPSRIDRSIHRPLVKMRVHHRNQANSMWLPLFSGPRRGRVRRLVRSLLGGD